MDLTANGSDVMENRRDVIRGIVSEILEIDSDSMDWSADFRKQFAADSLTMVEIAAEVEQAFNLTIEDSRSLQKASSLAAIYDIVGQRLQWNA